MRNSTVLLLAGLLLANANIARADQKQLSEEDKARILNAFHVLESTGVIKPNEDGKTVQVDKSVVDELVNQGLLKIEPSGLTVVCIGAGAL